MIKSSAAPRSTARPPHPFPIRMTAAALPDSARQLALAALAVRDWPAKLAAVRAIGAAASIDPDARLAGPVDLPRRPDAPQLVPPAQVKQRSVQSPEGRAALLHALAPIEFNAVNLALDAVRSEEHTSELQSLMRISYA